MVSEAGWPTFAYKHPIPSTSRAQTTGLGGSVGSNSFGAPQNSLTRTSCGNDTWKPVTYASRSLTDTEKWYAQFEKEGLAVTWACEKFSNYVLGCKFESETDHKP